MKKIKALLTSLAMLASTALAYSSAGVSAEPADLSGTYLIRNVNSGIYMNVEGGLAAEGTNVQQWGADYGDSNAVWKLVSAGNDYYKIYSMVGDGSYCLNVDKSNTLFGDNINIRANDNSDNQLYKLSANSDGSFKILTKCSGDTHTVEIKDAETTSGSNVQQWENNGVNCQDWQLIPINYVVSDKLDETVGTSTGDEFTSGDLNDDGKINVFDSIIAKRLLISGAATEHQKHAGNIDGDKEFTVADLKMHNSFLLGKDEKFVKEDIPFSKNYPAVNGEFEFGVKENTNAGFNSESYLNLDNAKNINASWNVKADTEGVYAVTFRYANGGADSRNSMITVGNNIVYWEAEFASTAAWTTWSEVTLNLPLKAGMNKITLTSLTDSGAPNIDTVTVKKSDLTADSSKPISPIAGTPKESNGRVMEKLDRGVCAAYNGSGMLVSWRTLATDSANTTFKVYQNGTLIKEVGAGEATNCFVSGATAADKFTVDTYVNGFAAETGNEAIMLGNKNSGQSGGYMDIALEKPADQTMPDGTTCTYTPNDASVGDADGDGEYEIYLKWDPSNSQDNSKNGYTGTVFIDCYKLDGTRLFRIDLGKNIRAGAHYTQFMVYDFDCDGKSELMCKTSDGTVDGKGKVVGDGSKDYRDSNGRILTGNEYLTLFDGYTGAALDTVNYTPARGTVSDWGDNYGNRVDRFLSGVAYLDGKTPSAVFARGYYTRTAIATYDIVDKKIVERWVFDTGHDSSNKFYGQGNHSLAVMDVDTDGKDEIIYGSCCIDDNGKGLYSTGYGHGDCMQAGDLIPEREGLEIFQVHEEEAHWCGEIHDAKTGQIIFEAAGTGDVGRGIALNMDASNPGMEFTSIADSVVYGYNPSSGKVESLGYSWSNVTKWGMNSAVWYDGDLEREPLDRTMIDGYNKGRLFTGDASYNNGSKSNASLTADIFGDWREELIFPANDGTTLRIFSTTYETDVKLFTLMHDSQYRTGVAIENVGYNQAPNTSFFLGTGYALPETPEISVP